jgi:hypothetical protein
MHSISSMVKNPSAGPLWTISDKDLHFLHGKNPVSLIRTMANRKVCSFVAN